MDTEDSDENLMLKYRRGDAGAFEVLYRRHKGGVYRYVLRQCHDQSLSEELFQDIWINLINARLRYEVRAKFTTWLYQIARNRVIDHFRRNPDPGVNGKSENNVDPDELPGRQQDQPEQRTEIQNKSARLLQLIDGLPVEQKEVFLLREEAGMSISEIVETTGTNTETVKSRLRYAVKKLRAELSD